MTRRRPSPSRRRQRRAVPAQSRRFRQRHRYVGVVRTDATTPSGELVTRVDHFGDHRRGIIDHDDLRFPSRRSRSGEDGRRASGNYNAMRSERRTPVSRDIGRVTSSPGSRTSPSGAPSGRDGNSGSSKKIDMTFNTAGSRSRESRYPATGLAPYVAGDSNKLRCSIRDPGFRRMERRPDPGREPRRRQDPVVVPELESSGPRTPLHDPEPAREGFRRWISAAKTWQPTRTRRGETTKPSSRSRGPGRADCAVGGRVRSGRRPVSASARRGDRCGRPAGSVRSGSPAFTPRDRSRARRARDDPRADAGSFGTARRRSRAGDGSRGSSRQRPGSGRRPQRKGAAALSDRASAVTSLPRIGLRVPDRGGPAPLARERWGTIAGGRRRDHPARNQGALGGTAAGTPRRGSTGRLAARGHAIAGGGSSAGRGRGSRDREMFRGTGDLVLVHVRPCRDPGGVRLPDGEESGRGSGVAATHVQTIDGIPATLTSRMVSAVARRRSCRSPSLVRDMVLMWSLIAIRPGWRVMRRTAGRSLRVGAAIEVLRRLTRAVGAWSGRVRRSITSRRFTTSS